MRPRVAHFSMKTPLAVCAVAWLVALLSPASFGQRQQLVAPPDAAPTLPTIDLSGENSRHVVLAPGTAEIYQGHPTTVLLPDGRTIVCVWSTGHGGPAG